MIFLNIMSCFLQMNISNVIIELVTSTKYICLYTERVSGAIAEKLSLSAEQTGQLMQVLLRPHKHKHRGGKSKGKDDTDTGKKKGLQMKYDLDKMDEKQSAFPGEYTADDLQSYKASLKWKMLFTYPFFNQ